MDIETLVINNTTDFDAVLAAVCGWRDGSARAVLVKDETTGDSAHDGAIGLIRRIVREGLLPVYGSGNIHRLEDVKKLLYAGCVAVVLQEEETDPQGKETDPQGKETDPQGKKTDPQGKKTDPQGKETDQQGKETDPQGKKTDQQGKETDPQGKKTDLQEEELGLLEEARARFGADRVLTSDPVLPEVSSLSWSEFKPDANGLIPCIVQDDVNGEVLMMAYMNEESFRLTLKTGRMTYWSRSRQEIWVKGLTSGHYQFVKSLHIDCDGDTLLAKVAQAGAACHTGNRSCFYREIFRIGHPASDPQRVLQDVYAVIADRKANPREGSYTNYLFDKGIDKILKKVGEEAAEIIIAAKNPDRTESIYEIADLLYHLMVLMCEKGLTWEDIAGELADRE